MANEQNQLTTPNPQIPDMEPDGPTAEDGGSDSGLRPAERRLEVGSTADEGEERAAPQQWKDEAREAIARKAKETRSAKYKPYGGDPNETNVNYGEQEELSDLERQALDQQRRHQQGETEAATGQRQPQQRQQPSAEDEAPVPGIEELDPIYAKQKVKIKIDGRETFITVEEAMRHVQMHGAADKRFETARRMVQQAHELIEHVAPEARSPQGQQPQRRDNPFDQQGDTSPAMSDEDRAALIEKIQLGSPQEALEAFDKMAAAMSQKTQPQEDAYRVLSVLEDRNSIEALNAFAAKHPEVADPDLQILVSRNMGQVMATDLLNAGYSEDWLRANVHGPEQLKDLHRRARIDRLPGVRSTSEVLEIAFAKTREKATSWTGTQARPSTPGQQTQQRTTGAPARPMPNRADRKAALPAQPPQRGASRQPLPTQQVTIEQSRSDAVARMRKARGQGA